VLRRRQDLSKNVKETRFTKIIENGPNETSHLNDKESILVFFLEVLENYSQAPVLIPEKSIPNEKKWYMSHPLRLVAKLSSLQSP